MIIQLALGVPVSLDLLREHHHRFRGLSRCMARGLTQRSRPAAGGWMWASSPYIRGHLRLRRTTAPDCDGGGGRGTWVGHARYQNVRCHHVTVSQPTGGNSPSIQGSLRPVSGSWAWRRGRLLPEGGRTDRDASAIRMGDTTYHAMAFAEGDIDNDGRFERLPGGHEAVRFGSRHRRGLGTGAAAGRRTTTTRDGPDIRQCPPGAGRGRRVPQPRGRRPGSTPPAGTGRLSSAVWATTATSTCTRSTAWSARRSGTYPARSCC